MNAEQVKKIIESFEAEAITEDVALTELRQLAQREVDGNWLRNYWRSESLEDFVDRLCAKPIADWRLITDSDALTLIAEYLQTESPGRKDSIQTGLERRFGKPTGTLNELIYEHDLLEPDVILDELKKDTRIYL